MSNIKKIDISEEEYAALIRDLPHRTVIRTTFGPSGVRLVVDLDDPQTHAPANLLMAMRGISNQNCDGLGI